MSLPAPAGPDFWPVTDRLELLLLAKQADRDFIERIDVGFGEDNADAVAARYGEGMRLILTTRSIAVRAHGAGHRCSNAIFIDSERRYIRARGGVVINPNLESAHRTGQRHSHKVSCKSSV